MMRDFSGCHSRLHSAFGFRISDFGFRISVFGSRISVLGSRISDFGFRFSLMVSDPEAAHGFAER